MILIKIILVLVFFTPKFILGQSKSLNVTRDYAIQNKLIHYRNSIDSFHFRFSTENQAVEIWTNDYLHFHGIFLNFTKSQNIKPEIYYSQVNSIDTFNAKYIYNLLSKSGIFQIPTQENIHGWQNGLDGEYYIIQYSTPKIYSYKKYWSPDAFKNIKEAVIIDSVYKQIYRVLKIGERWSNFIGLLPIGCYEFGDGLVSCTKHKHKKK